MSSLPACKALLAHGDVTITNKWLSKLSGIYESIDIRTDPSLFVGGKVIHL